MDPVDKRELTILSEIGRIATSSARLEEKLQRIIDVVMRGMEKDGASVFLLDASGKNVTLVAAQGLNQESIGTLTFPLGAGIAGWVAQQKVPLALADPYSDPRFQYVPETGIERFRSLVAAPIMDEDRCLGVIFVLSQPAWTATGSEVTLLTTIANQISGVTKSTQLFQSIQDRLAELATIHEIGMALTSTLDLAQLLSLIAANTTQALHARGCTIRLVNLPEIQSLTGQSVDRFVSDAVRDLDANFGEILAARTVQERRPLLIEDIRNDASLAFIPDRPAGSLLSVPLIFHERVIGVITLYNPEDGSPFSEDDLQFLATIASGAAVAVENAAMYERMEYLANEAKARAQELSILYDVGTAMSATLNLDRLLRIILTAATMGGTGLGFNRAILLLTNERTNVLQGMMGVGPSSWEDASRAWTEVARKHKSLLEWIQTGELFEPRDTEINAIARTIRIPLEPASGVLAMTALEKRPFNIVDAASDPLVRPGLRDILKVDSFATVPLMAKSRAIGVILVDNMFTKRPITEHDIRFLTMFAQQAALAIDNAINHSNAETMNRDIRVMHEQLAQSEKMAALGVMMAEITHEIRNPLVSIGGFTRRLARKLTDPEAIRYIDIILGEVARLEGIIHDNLAYVKNVSPLFTRQRLNPLLDEMLAVFEEEMRQRGIRLEKSLADNLPDVEMDAQQMKQAAVNLVTNAMEAMERGGLLTVRTSLSAEKNEVVLEIGDTGPGVSSEAMHNLFNPYYTTKVKGTGLGLPITHRVIKSHKGTIVFRNKETGGALFIVRLPLPKEA
ncbi:MAG: GAF domain-containing protein [Nitrospiraceae bacterium]|nr:GAF domain-containing protein [Nitrospiraceae bacterium]